VDERGRRIGRNEALFREVNERIERVTQSMQVTAETITILCECGESTCSEQIQVTLSEYELVRREPTHFFICSGHEKPDVEDVVEQHPNYDVVRKKEGGAADMARALDPRDDQ
jgi:hypothetical protein